MERRELTLVELEALVCVMQVIQMKLPTMKQEKILYNIKQESQPSLVVEKFNAVPTVVSGGYINWGESPHL